MLVWLLVGLADLPEGEHSGIRLKSPEGESVRNGTSVPVSDVAGCFPIQTYWGIALLKRVFRRHSPSPRLFAKKALSGALLSALIAIGGGFTLEARAEIFLSSPVDTALSLNTKAGIYVFYTETGEADVSDMAFVIGASGSLTGTKNTIQVLGVWTAQDVSLLGNTLTNYGTITGIRNLKVVTNFSANLTISDSELSRNGLINAPGGIIRVLGGKTATNNANASLVVVDSSAGVFSENYLLNQGTIENNQGIWVVKTVNWGTYEGNYLINEESGRIQLDHKGILVTRGAGEHRNNYLRNDGEMEIPYYVIASKGDVGLGATIKDTSLVNTGSITSTATKWSQVFAVLFEELNPAAASEGIALIGVNNKLVNSGTIDILSSSDSSVNAVYAKDLTSAHTFLTQNSSLENTLGATIISNSVNVVSYKFTGSLASTRIENTRLINNGTLNASNVYGVFSLTATSSSEDVPVIAGTFLQNGGTITGQVVGVNIPYGAQVSETGILNTGSISGLVTGVLNSKEASETTIVNAGTIGGDLTGAGSVKETASLTTIVNTGLVGGAITGVSTNQGSVVTDANVVHEGGESISVTAVVIDSPSGAVTASDNAVYLGGGTTDAVAVVRLLGEAPEDYLIKDNKVYVYGDADLSTTAVSGVESASAIDLTDAEKVSGNELVFGTGAEVSWRDDGIADGIAKADKTWNQTAVLSVSNFNRVTVKSVDWNQPIEIGTLSALPDALGEKGSVEIDVSSVHFKNIEEIEVDDETVILKVQHLEGTLSLTSTESTYTVGTTLTGSATASLAKTFAENASEDTVIYHIAGVDDDAEDRHEDDDPPDDPQPGTPDAPSPSLTAQAQTHGAALAASAVTTLLTQGADAVGKAALSLQNSNVAGSQSFGVFEGAASRQKTGSHVDLKSLLFAVGVGSKMKTSSGVVSGGVAFEGGYGRFKNVFDAEEANPHIDKKGRVTTYGLALTGAMQTDGGWHIEGVLRGGRILTRQPNALWDASSRKNYGIDINAPYFGASLGAGKRFALTGENAIDLYAKYTFAYQGEDDFKAGGGDVYTVGKVTSHRLRVGARYERQIDAGNAWYAGLAYEREFDGKARVKVANGGVSTFAEPADVDGGRAYAELGYRKAPETGDGFAYEAAIKGLCGSGLRSAKAEIRLKYLF